MPVHLFRHHLAASPWQRRPPVPRGPRRAQVLPARWGCLAGGAWLAAVDWEGAAGARRAPPRPPLLLDMGDARMTFEALPGADAAAFGHAPATVLPAPARPPPVAPPPAGAGAAAAALARFNVSGDAAYAARAQRRGDRGGPAALARHATPAASLATLPVKALGRADLLHRPLAAFVPAPQPPRVKLGRGAAAPRGRARSACRLHRSGQHRVGARGGQCTASAHPASCRAHWLSCRGHSQGNRGIEIPPTYESCPGWTAAPLGAC
jgi:hypothetical protein